MGRSPDHVASTLTGMYQGLHFFEEYDAKRAAAFRDYFHYIRDNDLFLTYVIINPPEDRGKNPGERESNNVRVVDEDAEGITVEGCKMLGTSSVMADEVLVSCLQPLQAGDEDYALTFCVPMNHPGLKVLSRKSYEGGAHSVFDNPLSSRFDENDAVIYFEPVEDSLGPGLSCTATWRWRVTSSTRRPLTSSRTTRRRCAWR